MYRPIYLTSMQSCSMCRSESSEEYKLSDFVHEYRYEIDTTLTMSYEQALHALKHDFGPVFFNCAGQRVWFNGLDGIVQCEFITAVTRPIEDKEEFINTMPKGKWSDYREQGLLWDSGGVAEAKQRSRDEASAVHVSGGEYHNGRDCGASSQSTEAAAETLAISTDDIDRRKDSARSVEADLTKSLQPAQPYRLRSSTVEGSFMSLEETRCHYRWKAHDKIVFRNSYTTARRKLAAIQLNWHGSKHRVSSTLPELLAEWGEEHIVRRPHSLLAEGSISSTLSKASPLNH